jgi:ferric-dicitrate binding protein FerR (iron transport regulator)
MDKKLLLRYISGETTEKEKEEITEWLDADVENMQEFLALRKLNDITIWQYDPQSQQNHQKDGPRILWQSSKKIMTEVLKVAAVLVLAFILFRYFDKAGFEHASTQTLYVPAGQRALLTLSDSSKVWLNANTTFTFPNTFSSGTREVTLEGEGYFDIAHNASQPFVVKAGKYDIKVLGTEFNVLAYTENPEFEVSLLSGSVEVIRAGGKNGRLITPGQRIFMEKNSLRIAPIEHASYFMWKEGLISFDDEAFPEMVRKLERYFDLKIIVKNDKILQYRCTGKFRTKDGIEHILKVLQLSNRFDYSIDDKINVITIE